MIKRNIVLNFPKNLTKEPITYKLVKDYDLKFNILKARIKPDEQGRLLLQIEGTEDNLEKAMEYLSGLGIDWQTHSVGIKLDEEKCVHCTACTGTCPTKALSVDRETMKVNFDHEKCIACEMCLIACPYAAISLEI